MSVVGIDFGDESSKIAVAHSARIEVLQNDQSKRKTLTMVGYGGKQRIIGDSAVGNYTSNFKNSVTYMKRLLGKHFEDPDMKVEQEYIPYQLVRLDNGHIGARVMYADEQTVFSMESVTAALFQKLKMTAEKIIAQRVVDCVIGCPSYWNDEQRRALLDAANVAGLNVLRLMNETTAVALNYVYRPLPEKEVQNVMFIDVGHSSTQVAMVSFKAGELKVLASKAHAQLGARNWDKLLVDWLADYAKTKYNLDVRSNPKAMIKLFKEANRIKTTLSANSQVPFNLEYLMNDVDVKGMIDRAEFESIADKKGLLAALCVPVQQCLDACGMKKEAVDRVEIVGGGSRIPMIYKRLSDFVGKELFRTCDADEAVARGLTFMCAMISPSFRTREFQVHDTTPYAIDVGWGPVEDVTKSADWQSRLEQNALLFSENNAIPSVKMISFKNRTEPFQLVARYTNPEKLPPGTNPVIGRFVIRVPPNQPQGGKIKVKVKLDLHGILSVTSAQLLTEVKEEVKEDAKKDAAPATSPAPMEAEPTTAAPGADAATPAPASTPEANKMETDEQSKADKEDETTEKKGVKVVRSNLDVDSFFTGGLGSKIVSSLFEREATIHNQDRVIAETDEKRDMLEAYTLEMRNQIGDQLAEYVNEKDKQAFEDMLRENEDWLYGEGADAQKSVYVQRLTKLKEVGDKIVARKYEFQNRDQAIAALKSTIGKYTQMAASNDEKFSHITAEERQTANAALHDQDTWLSNSIIAQGKLSMADNPVLTVAEMTQRREHIERTVASVLTKPKPKPKEEPKPAPAAAPAGPDAAKAAPKDEFKNNAAPPAGGDKPADGAPMDTDGAQADGKKPEKMDEN